MHKTALRSLALLLLVALGAGGACAQGLYWESSTAVKEGAGGTINARSYIVPKMFKSVEGEQVVLIRLDREKLYSLDQAKKSYWEITFAEITAMMKKVSAQMEQVQKQLKNLPPDQQKAIEEQMGKGMADLLAGGGKIEIAPTKETKTIGGYACTKYVGTNGKNTLLVAWATNDVKGFAQLRNDWNAFYQKLMSLSPATSMGFGDAFRKIGGFPMELEVAGRTTVVTKVEQRSIPAAEFEVPPGFTKQQNPLLGMPGAQAR